jgi:hypothetical protein
MASRNGRCFAGKIAGLCVPGIFAAVSLLAGMYHRVAYLVLKVIFGNPARL